MSDTDSGTDLRLEASLTWAREAGDITLKYFLQKDLHVDTKSDLSPVTIADREAESHLRSRIAAAFPDDSIIGEEHGEHQGQSGYCWTLDPIDGTKSFVAGVPLYAVLIGLLKDGESVAGIINAAAAGEIVYASVGHGAWHTHGEDPPRRAHVSQTESLGESRFVTTEVRSFTKDRSLDAIDAFIGLQRTARVTRTWGDAYGYLLVVTGRADVMIDPAMHIWDAAPLLPIVEEAGGRFVDWKGNRTYRAGESVATNAHLLEEVLQYTRGR